MHGKKSEVGTHECSPEMQLAGPLRILVAAHLPDPVIHRGKQTEGCAQRHHIMKMRDDVIRVLSKNIESRVRKVDAGHPAYGEHHDEAERPQHRSA